MHMKQKGICMLFLLLAVAGSGLAQETTEQKALEIYGFIMTDAGYNANQIHPDWYDVVRPTKLPAYEGQYGTDGNAYFSVQADTFWHQGLFADPAGRT